MKMYNLETKSEDKVHLEHSSMFFEGCSNTLISRFEQVCGDLSKVRCYYTLN